MVATSGLIDLWSIAALLERKMPSFFTDTSTSRVELVSSPDPPVREKREGGSGT